MPPLKGFEFEPIGLIQTCFRQKFGIPRQPLLAASAPGILKLKDDPHFKTALAGLEGFSHLWLIFVFHDRNAVHWKPSVRPPRLGGAKKMGVLATRSPHRPNPIGLSVVKLDRIDYLPNDGIEIHLSGVDLLDQTPILDIKPYLPYADSHPEAKTGWAQDPIRRVQVEFSECSLDFIREKIQPKYPNFLKLSQDLLELDPRPAFQKERFPVDEVAGQNTRYGFQLYEFNVTWTIQNQRFLVIEVEFFDEARHSAVARINGAYPK